MLMMNTGHHRPIRFHACILFCMMSGLWLSLPAQAQGVINEQALQDYRQLRNEMMNDILRSHYCDSSWQNGKPFCDLQHHYSEEFRLLRQQLFQALGVNAASPSFADTTLNLQEYLRDELLSPLRREGTLEGLHFYQDGYEVLMTHRLLLEEWIRQDERRTLSLDNMPIEALITAAFDFPMGMIEVTRIPVKKAKGVQAAPAMIGIAGQDICYLPPNILAIYQEVGDKVMLFVSGAGEDDVWSRKIDACESPEITGRCVGDDEKDWQRFRQYTACYASHLKHLRIQAPVFDDMANKHGEAAAK